MGDGEFGLSEVMALTFGSLFIFSIVGLICLTSNEYY